MHTLLPYLKPFKKQCIIGPFAKLSEAILEVILPTIMAFVIDEGVMKHDFQLVLAYGGLMIFMVFIGFGFSITCQYNAAKASQGFGTNLRNALFEHITTFSYQDIDHFSTSALTNRLTNDVNQLQIGVAMLIRLVVRSPFIVIGALMMAFFLDYECALILLGSVPFIIIVLFLFIKYSSPIYIWYQKKLDAFANLLDDNFAGIRVIRAFVSQRLEKRRVDDAAFDLQQQMMKVSKLSALLNPVNALIVNGAILVLLYISPLRLESGSLAPGVIIAMINYASQILVALIAVSNMIVIFTKANASIPRIVEVLEYNPTFQEGNKSTPKYTKETLNFSHVSFSYGQGEEALSDISFIMHEGERIGIIGGTGCGKSTLAYLMCHLYEPTKGSISLYEQPINEYTNAALLENITMVPQTNELFSGTIKENLCHGSHTCQEDINKALRDAQAMEFIEQLPKGLDTLLERSASNLSGGQKQRLCIARALLYQPKTLILDDSCSALDFKTDALLREALRTRASLSNQIIISQRVATLLNCDRILVLHDGRMVGFDTHNALYETCSIYQEICNSQNIGRLS
ncbi:MAG: ABC transporter ATP-binding protein [Longicatena sp.]